jgi:hypothetical protein
MRLQDCHVHKPKGTDWIIRNKCGYCNKTFLQFLLSIGWEKVSGSYPAEAVEPSGVGVPEQRLGVHGQHVVDRRRALVYLLLDVAPHLYQPLLPHLRRPQMLKHNSTQHELAPPTRVDRRCLGEIANLEAAALHAMGDEEGGDAAEYAVRVPLYRRRRSRGLPLWRHRRFLPSCPLVASCGVLECPNDDSDFVTHSQSQVTISIP